MEHPVLAYLEFERATAHQRRIEVAKNKVISKALNDVACAPFTSFKIVSSPGSSTISFGPAKDDKAFGSIDKPNVDKIMDVAKENQSKFGRGEQTVLDLDYRNGYEIEAKDLAGLRGLDKKITPVLNETLFVGRKRKVEVKLYKLAVYKEGGHFDWHRDTTHGDNHHGTVLVSLNTAWKGGALLLRHRGVETTFDMQPATKGQFVEMQAVAFYTDVEHKVDPVTEGMRVVLQYDVYVTTTPTDCSDPEDEDEDEDEDRENEPIYDLINTDSSRYKLPDVTENEEALELLITTLQASLKSKETQEIGFPLRHLYRQQSILPQYLKGVDALIYRRLSPLFEVSLHPILLIAKADYESGSYTSSEASTMVIKCMTEAKPEPTEEEEESDEDYDSDEAEEGAEFFLYDAIDVCLVSSVDYVEYTGNEAQEGSSKYFGGGMFVRVKENAGDKRVLKGAKSAAKRLKE